MANQLKKITVNASSVYDILIEKGLISKIGSTAKSLFKGRKAMIVSDSNVAPLYIEEAITTLKENGFEAYTFVFEAGEESKNSQTLLFLLSTLAKESFCKDDFLVALGGGVVGDTTGFAASVYMRGIGFMAVPTSLLSMIDSSVGGKTAINLPEGKNLCGTFYQPKIVLIDPVLLSTLPQKYSIDGLGEVLKYSIIKSSSLFSRLDKEDPYEFLDDIIFECVSIKKTIVEKDEFESGERMLLNLGHTFGHAIEVSAGYGQITHGEAVALGIIIASDIGVSLGVCTREDKINIISVMSKLSLPTEMNYHIDELMAAISVDKKCRNGYIYFVLFDKIGHGMIQKLTMDEIRKAVHSNE